MSTKTCYAFLVYTTLTVKSGYFHASWNFLRHMKRYKCSYYYWLSAIFLALYFLFYLLTWIKFLLKMWCLSSMFSQLLLTLKITHALNSHFHFFLYIRPLNIARFLQNTILVHLLIGLMGKTLRIKYIKQLALEMLRLTVLSLASI